MTDLILIFDTSLGDGTPEIGVNLGGTVDVSVDWGDGTSDAYTTSGYKLHTYASGGVYEVRISGSLTQFGGSTSTHQAKITECRSFGDLGLTSLVRAFLNCSNILLVPDDIPPTVTTINGIFVAATSFNGPEVSGWNVENVTNMGSAFFTASSFNQDLTSWCVTNIPTEPSNFATGSALTPENKPVWGTCPAPATGSNGSGSGTASEAIASGTGSTLTSGSGAGTASGATVSGAGSVATNGTGGAVASVQIASGSGGLIALGAGAATAPRQAANGTGSILTIGSGSGSARVHIASGAGVTRLFGNGAGIAANVTASGQGDAFFVDNTSAVFRLTAVWSQHEVPALWPKHQISANQDEPRISATWWQQ